MTTVLHVVAALYCAGLVALAVAYVVDKGWRQP
jgi:hypothetical protein